MLMLLIDFLPPTSCSSRPPMRRARSLRRRLGFDEVNRDRIIPVPRVQQRVQQFLVYSHVDIAQYPST